MRIFRGYDEFTEFSDRLHGCKALVVGDINTYPFASGIMARLESGGNKIGKYEFAAARLVPEIDNLSELSERAKNYSYILGVGSGVINDICKYVSFTDGVPYGIFATAPSMDGYVSSVSALYEHGKKVTLPTTIPQDVLIDLDVLKNAPLDMIVAGAGDLIGKYTSLTDWKLSHVLNGETYDAAIVERMNKALDLCMSNARKLTDRNESAVSALIEGLILSGVEMQNAGNSRPASGSEHHISHYLEMAGERIGVDFAPHGIKVALGCLVSVYMYRKASEAAFSELLPLKREIDGLPTVEYLEKLYSDIGLPTRFGEIGVSRELLKETVENAYTVRQRYTVMTFLNEKGLLRELSGEIADKFA